MNWAARWIVVFAEMVGVRVERGLGQKTKQRSKKRSVQVAKSRPLRNAEGVRLDPQQERLEREGE